MRLIDRIADRLNLQRSAGFPWSKGVPDRNFPRPMTGGSGCMAPIVLICVIATAMLLGATLIWLGRPTVQ